MLKILTNLDLYRYEIHALVKAFFPAEDVKVFLAGEIPEKEAFLTVWYRRASIRIAFAEDGPSCTAVADGQEDCTEKTKNTKNALKHGLYHLLEEYTGRSLPWGELIGIRPTKIIRKSLREGATFEEAVSSLQREHFVSPGKAALALEVAKREEALLSSLHGTDGFSLYVGIPFCPTTCLYCSFPSNAVGRWKERLDEYVTGLIEEMQDLAPLFQGKTLDTVYFGGGTPTTLEAAQLDRLLAAVEETFSTKTCLEYTVEAGRPDSITPEKLQVLRSHAVGRISINPQTMQEETLRRIGRAHSPADVENAFRLARDRGFTNINMDIILGLPGEGAEDVRKTVEAIEKLGPDSLTVHTLAVKRGSALDARIREEGYQAVLGEDPPADPIEAMMAEAAAAAARMGLFPYYLYRQKNLTGNHENIGFARPGCFGLYNSLIIEETQSILALGAGSISKRVDADGGIRRQEDPKDIATYLEEAERRRARKRALFSV